MFPASGQRGCEFTESDLYSIFCHLYSADKQKNFSQTLQIIILSGISSCHFLPNSLCQAQEEVYADGDIGDFPNVAAYYNSSEAKLLGLYTKAFWGAFRKRGLFLSSSEALFVI